MRNVLLMGVNWNSPCGALSRWCGMTILSAWRSVLVKIVVVNKILMRFMWPYVDTRQFSTTEIEMYSSAVGSSFVVGLSKKQVINLVWPYTSFTHNLGFQLHVLANKLTYDAQI